MEPTCYSSAQSTAASYYYPKYSGLSNYQSYAAKSSLYETYHNKNSMLEHEVDRVNQRIKNDFNAHWIKSSIVKPCQVKDAYMGLLKSSFCAKDRTLNATRQPMFKSRSQLHL